MLRAEAPRLGVTGASILIVEDEPSIREGLGTAVRRAGMSPVLAAGLREARAALAGRELACVLLDLRLEDGDGLELLREIKRGPRRALPVVIATAYGDGERTIAAMRDGAFDYLTKPFDLPALLATVQRAARQYAATPAAVEEQAGGDAELVGRSAAMHALRKLIGRAAASDDPVLVTGEPGTGKALVARVIHKFSPREKETLMSLRGAAAEPAVLERALATRRGVVLVEHAEELPRDAQRLLAQSLGSKLPVRVMATARDASHGAEAPLLDELYYRLAVLEIGVPPLRARRSDVPLLVAHALNYAGRSPGAAAEETENTARPRPRGPRENTNESPARAVSEQAMLRLVGRDWAGNVRELFHVVRRAAALCDGEIVDAHHLPPEMSSEAPPTGNPYAGMPMREAVGALERDLLRAALEQAKGNRTVAAKLLGIARPQLYAKLDEHGLAERKDR